MAHSEATANFLIESRLRDAAAGNIDACFDLGIAFSAGADGLDIDLVEAHKWFNLAAVSGHDKAQRCRAEISDEMTAREIAQAQKRARAWLSGASAQAA